MHGNFARGIYLCAWLVLRSGITLPEKTTGAAVQCRSPATGIRRLGHGIERSKSNSAIGRPVLDWIITFSSNGRLLYRPF